MVEFVPNLVLFILIITGTNTVRYRYKKISDFRYSRSSRMYLLCVSFNAFLPVITNPVPHGRDRSIDRSQTDKQTEQFHQSKVVASIDRFCRYSTMSDAASFVSSSSHVKTNTNTFDSNLMDRIWPPRLYVNINMNNNNNYSSIMMISEPHP
jgi:hypothetical protein